MLEDNYRQDLTSRLAQTACSVEVPQSLRHLLCRRGPELPRQDERRRFARISSPAKMLLEVTTTIKCIQRPPQFFAVLTLDVSREGVAFLHAAELFPGEVPILWFRSGKLACRVVRCLRHNARCFETGAVFDAGRQTQAWLRDVSGDCTPDCGTRTLV
jgi:hypothetical protein